MLIKYPYELEAGMILAEDIVNTSGGVILNNGTKLTQSHIRALERMNLDMIRIVDSENEMDAGKGAMNPVMASKAQSLKESYDRAIDLYKEIYKAVRSNETISHESVKDVVESLIKEYYKYDDIVTILKHTRTHEKYAYSHSPCVCILAILLGKWLKLDNKDLYTLAESAFLADIGMAKLPEAVLNKKDKLTEAEWHIVKKHVNYSKDVLARSGGFDNEVIQIVATHHEHLDGTGYPCQLEGNQVNRLSRIVSVADTYHALISARPYREAYTIFEAAELLWNMSYNALDPKVAERLVKYVTAFLVGGRVKLSSGETGEVIMANPYDKFRPLVKVGDQFIDLSQNRAYKIVGLMNKTN